MVHFKELLDACNATLHPTVSVRRLVSWSVSQSVGWSPFWAEALKGSMTYAFTHMGNFFLLLLLLLLCPPPQIPVSRPKFQSQGQNPSPEAQIPALRPKSQPGI